MKKRSEVHGAFNMTRLSVEAAAQWKKEAAAQWKKEAAAQWKKETGNDFYAADCILMF